MLIEPAIDYPLFAQVKRVAADRQNAAVLVLEPAD